MKKVIEITFGRSESGDLWAKTELETECFHFEMKKKVFFIMIGIL